VRVCGARTGDSPHYVDWIGFSSQGDKITYTSFDTAGLWDLTTKKEVWMSKCGSIIAEVSPDGTHGVASGRDQCIKIWNTEGGYSTPVGTEDYFADTLTFTRDGRLMVSQTPCNVKVWDTTSGELLFKFNRHQFGKSVLASPDSTFVACLSRKSRARVWDVHTRRMVKDVRVSVKADSIGVALSPCGGRFLSYIMGSRKRKSP
jgi:WD40 repeat protein